MGDSLNVRGMFVEKGLCGRELKCEGHVCREGPLVVESLNVRGMFVGKGLCGGELKCEAHVCREGPLWQRA